MPGEPPAVFGDALRRLAGAATYLYQDGTRYWYSTQPTVTNLAEGRAEQLRREPEKVATEIERRVRRDVREAGDFSRVHPFPQSSADVSDDLDARLVVLGTSAPHTRDEASPALAAARQILASRGSAPRIYSNALVFLAADRGRLQDLEDAARRYLAWETILADKEPLNLDPHQVRQAESQKQAAEGTVEARLPETFQWMLVPMQVDPQSGQPDPKAEVTWQSIRLQGNDPLAVRVGKKLRNEELLLVSFAGTRLRMELDRVPLWRGDHVDVRQLVEDFARYLYLPRLKSPAVLAGAVRDGVSLLTGSERRSRTQTVSTRQKGDTGGYGLHRASFCRMSIRPDSLSNLTSRGGSSMWTRRPRRAQWAHRWRRPAPGAREPPEGRSPQVCPGPDRRSPYRAASTAAWPWIPRGWAATRAASRKR
jgi:predicted AAA+ superfamily ATPase